MGILVAFVKLISIRSGLIALGKMENGNLKKYISANRQFCTSKNHYLIVKIFTYGGGHTVIVLCSGWAQNSCVH